jgi:hypothetical protein
MSFIHSRRSTARIRVGNAVDWSWPVTRGLIGLWLAIPQIAGGPKWYDMLGLYPGTLNNFGSTAGWRGGNLWGMPAITFTGAASQLISTGLLPPTGSAPRSFFSTFATTNNLSSFPCLYYYGTTSSNAEIVVYLSSGPAISLDGNGNAKTATFPNANDGNPHSFGVSYPGGVAMSNAHLIGDGINLGGSGGASIPNTGNANNFTMAATDPWFGLMGCHAVWNRALSDGELLDMHIEAKTQYRRLLNRIGRSFGGVKRGLLLARRRKAAAA